MDAEPLGCGAGHIPGTATSTLGAAAPGTLGSKAWRGSVPHGSPCLTHPEPRAAPSKSAVGRKVETPLRRLRRSSLVFSAGGRPFRPQCSWRRKEGRPLVTLGWLSGAHRHLSRQPQGPRQTSGPVFPHAHFRTACTSIFTALGSLGKKATCNLG